MGILMRFRQHRDLRTFEDLLEAVETFCEWFQTKDEEAPGWVT